MATSTPGVKAVFDRVLQIATPAAREAFLAKVGAQHPSVRQKVEALLKAHAATGELVEEATLDAPAASATATFGAATPTTVHYSGKDEQVGAVIVGRYKLMEVIGEGGMGSVYRAQQSEPVKRAVAIKVIKAGMDSKAVLARFDAERQALAMMDHPNIAKVLDAGTTESGRPFFVMELVKGVPITDYCDTHKLTPRQRLELFVPVCQAIQHAHMKGIIHRDIKPSNVLVAVYDDRPVPKVIDFGVAKATGPSLTDQTMMTGIGAVVGTPEYMSPEQASFNQLDVDTRSDIYSLGVMLYELLTGSTPVDRKSLGKAALLEVLRIVREEEAPRPSAKLSTIDTLPSVAAKRSIEPAKLSKLMKGELDWILLKALEKDRVRRYESANGFAMDIQRYLCGETVQAHPPSTAYRLKKFVRRNKGQVIAASLVLFTLLAGMAGTVWGLIEARRQEQIARAESDEKEQARRDEAARAEGERQAKQEAIAKGVEAKKQEAEAKRQEAEAKKKLIRFRVATGTNAVDRGELWEALVWYAKAWQDDSDPQNEPAHRMRIASTLNRSPNLVAAFFHDRMIFDALLSSDGSRLVTITEDGVDTQLFNVVTQSLVARLTPDVKVKTAAFSSDGKLLATGSDDHKVHLWKSDDGTLAREPLETDSPVVRLAFHPSRPLIAVITEKSTLILYDLERKERVAVTDPLKTKAMAAKGYKCYLAFSADGSKVLAALDDQYRVWDSITGMPSSPILGCKEMVIDDIRFKNGPGISPDGLRTVGVKGKGLAVFEAASGKTLCELPESTAKYVLQAVFSPDGKRVLSISNHGMGFFYVHDSQSGKLIRKCPHPRSVMAAVWSPDGQRIVSASAGGEIHLWDAEDGRQLALANKHAVSTSRLAFSANGQQVLVADLDGTVRLWEYPPPTAPVPYDLAEGRDPWNGTASQDGRFILMKGAKANERILGSAKTGKALDLPPFEITSTLAGRFTPDGTRVLIVNPEGQGQVYETATGRAVGPASKPAAEKWARSTALSPDGSLWAIGGSSSRAETYDSATGRKQATVNHNYDIIALSFDASGQRLATCSYDCNARVWNAKTGTPLSPQLHHKGTVFGASFSPDGRSLVTGSGEGGGNLGANTIQLWDIRTGDPLGPPLIHPNNGKPWFDSDVRSVIFGNGDKYLRWKLPNFFSPAAEVPYLVKLYSGRFVDETDGLSTIKKTEFVQNSRRYRQAWFASLGKEVPEVMVTPLSPAASSIASEAVSLEIAQQSLGKSIVVEYTVEYVGRSNSGGWVFLNSKKDFEAKDNFTVAIRNGATREEEFGLKEDLVGRTIRVIGTVAVHKGQKQIVVENKSQLHILPR